MPPKVLIIVNPAAGHGHAAQKAATLAHALEPDYSVTQRPLPPHDHDALQTLVSEDDWQVVVAAGGDGTARAVAAAVIPLQKVMAVLPAGSGNGWARYLGTPNHPEKLAQSIRQGRTTRLDVGYVNNEPFINIAGAGFDGAVAQAFDRLPHRGVWAYVKSIIQAYFRLRPLPCRLRFAEWPKGVENELVWIAFANGQQYGHQARIAPQADMSDGKLEVVMIKNVRGWQVPGFVWQLFRGAIHRHRAVQIRQTDSVHVTFSEPAPLHLDGEVQQAVKKLEVRVEAGKLRVWC